MTDFLHTLGDAAADVFNETKEEVIAGGMAVAFHAVQQYHPIKTIMPDILRLIKDLWNVDHLSGKEKHAKVMADLQKVGGEIEDIAIGLIEGEMGFLVSTAIGVAHAYLKTHMDEAFGQA